MGEEEQEGGGVLEVVGGWASVEVERHNSLSASRSASQVRNIPKQSFGQLSATYSAVEFQYCTRVCPGIPGGIGAPN